MSLLSTRRTSEVALSSWRIGRSQTVRTVKTTPAGGGMPSAMGDGKLTVKTDYTSVNSTDVSGTCVYDLEMKVV